MKADNKTPTTRIASCNCGQIRVTHTGEDPERRSLCNCLLCQRQSGSAFAIQARFPIEEVKIEGKTTAWQFPMADAEPEFDHCAEEGAKFHFCPVCGSTVYYTSLKNHSFVGIKIGAFADPTFPEPVVEGYTAYRHEWTLHIEDLPMEVEPPVESPVKP